MMYPLFDGLRYSGDDMVNWLRDEFPDLLITRSDLRDIDGYWTIDGMDPVEWCESMMQE